MKAGLFSSILLINLVGLVLIYGHFPPTLESQLQCGRESFKKIYVCDPDKILGTRDDEVSQLDVIIKKIANESTCPCSSYTCDEKKVGGYKVAVAVAERMFEEDIIVEDDDGYDPKLTKQLMITKRLKEASKIADRLRKQWKLGSCEEDVLIFYSRNDEVVYTMMGDVARMKLTRNLVDEIAQMAIKRGFSKSPFDGIRSILSDYRAVFLGTYRSRSPRAGHQTSSRALSSFNLDHFTLLISLTLITSLRF